jgi:hypothetical protein
MSHARVSSGFPVKYRSIGTADRTTTGWVHGAPVSGQGSDDPTRRLAAGPVQPGLFDSLFLETGIPF